MLTSHMPKRLRVLKYLFISLLSLLLLVYLVFAIIRAVNSPVLLDTQLTPKELVPPVVIIDGNRDLFAQSEVYVQGLYLDSTGQEASTGNLQGALAIINYGSEIETNFPDAFNDALNQQRVTWWLRPRDDWRFAVNFTKETGNTSNKFTALRIGVRLPATAGSPSLDIRLLEPDATLAYVTQSQLSPVGTTAVGRNREVRYTETQVAHLNGKRNTLYSAINLDYSMPNVTNPPSFFITLRPGNSLDDSGKFRLIEQTERLAFTWYDVLTGAGGLFGILTAVYFFLFGASKLRTWGPVQWVMRKDIIEGTNKIHEKERGEKAALSVEDRLHDLESFKDRINHYYVEHSLFEDKYTDWF